MITKVSLAQVKTLDAMNIKTNEVYTKNVEKLDKIKDEVKVTSDYCIFFL